MRSRGSDGATIAKMPKRSNAFQRVVRLIHHQLAGVQCTVEESAMLVDELTGDSVEVDIVVKTSGASYPITIGVECTCREPRPGSSKRPQRRRATVEWVREMYGKHEHLHTDVLVLASEAGFTKGAATLAAKVGIRTLSFDDATRLNWSHEIETLTKLFLGRIDLTYRGEAILEDGEHVRDQGAAVFDAKGLAVGSLLGVIGSLVNHPSIREQAWAKIPHDGQGKLSVDYDAIAADSPAWFLDRERGEERTKMRIRSLHADVTVKRMTVPVEVKQAAINAGLVAYGEGLFGDGRATLALLEDEDGHKTGSLLIAEADGKDRHLVVMKSHESSPPRQD